jgi:cell wall-associated NlpC family hydrolase
LKPGDLIFYDSTKVANDHVAIYLGNRKIIDAPQTFVDPNAKAGPHDYVRIENMHRPGGSELHIFGFGTSRRFSH